MTIVARTPWGTPAGGEFASRARPEGNVILAAAAHTSSVSANETTVKKFIAALPLKEMEASLLRSAILDAVAGHGMSAQYREAIDLASYLHRNQTRQNRGDMPKVHYIEHPLRNTLRLIRYGVSDDVTLLATVLHDTVEDHAKEIATSFCGMTGARSERQLRELAFDYIGSRFGPDVTQIVRSMSNPLKDGILTREESNRAYIHHVLEEIADPRVFLSKFADFADNALSLHHSMNPKMTVKLATKYVKLVEPFGRRLDDADLREFVDEVGIAKMRAHLDGNRLAEFATA
jgi:(p)ppGpp synthase/HD superfamily hydrolase